ncbi:MAG: hypothetical protein ACRBHB_08435 [Arenicella sp.]
MHFDIKQGWVPRQFVERSGKAYVEFVDFNNQELKASFLRQDLERYSRRVFVELDSLWQYECSSEFLSQNIKGMIFHMSRCGSTLAANMLRQHRACQVIAEADVIGQFLHTFRGPQHELVRHLRLILSLLFHSFCNNNQTLIIKWTSWNIFIIDAICQAVPSVPLCYLYREPDEVLVSLTQNLAEWQDPKLIKRKLNETSNSFQGSAKSNPYIDLLIRSKAETASTEEIAARFIGQCCTAAFESKTPLLMVPYPSLPEAVFTHIAPHMDIEMDGMTKSLARTESRWNTKTIDQSKVYSSDTNAKKKRVTPTMRTLIDEHISQPLESLKQASTEQFSPVNAKTNSNQENLIIENQKNNKPEKPIQTKPVVKWL